MRVRSCDGKASRGPLQAIDGSNPRKNQKKAERRPGCLINNRLAAVVPADPAIMELLGRVSQEDTQSSEKNGEIGVAEEAERKKNSK